jgi:hypothetical protein
VNPQETSSTHTAVAAPIPEVKPSHMTAHPLPAWNANLCLVLAGNVQKLPSALKAFPQLRCRQAEKSPKEVRESGSRQKEKQTEAFAASCVQEHTSADPETHFSVRTTACCHRAHRSAAAGTGCRTHRALPQPQG